MCRIFEEVAAMEFIAAGLIFLSTKSLLKARDRASLDAQTCPDIVAGGLGKTKLFFLLRSFPLLRASYETIMSH